MKNLAKLKFYATAKRAGASSRSIIKDGDFLDVWDAMLKGKRVRMEGAPDYFATRCQAVEHAREFRAACASDLANG